MSKRPASYSIDEHTYEEKEIVREGNQSIDDEDKHLTNRKIYKLKKSGTSASQGTGSVDLKIKGITDNNDVKEPAKDIKVPQNPFKLNLFNQSQGVGLFSNLFSKPAAPNSQPVPVDNAAKVPPKTTLASNSLFDMKTSGNGNIFTNPTVTSIFGSNTLFSNPNPSSILFGGTNTSSLGSTSLFGNKITGPITAPPEDDSGDSQELEKDQQMVVDPNKSTVQFDYGEQTKYIKKIAVAKFKKDKGNLIEGVEAIIKFDSETKINYLLIRLAATKNIISSGIILPRKSSVKRSGENLDVLTFEFTPKKTLEAHRVKMQIKGLDEELGEFEQEIHKIIEQCNQNKSDS